MAHNFEETERVMRVSERRRRKVKIAKLNLRQIKLKQLIFKLRNIQDITKKIIQAVEEFGEAYEKLNKILNYENGKPKWPPIEKYWETDVKTKIETKEKNEIRCKGVDTGTQNSI